jgi:hypothetical protein
MARSRPFDHLGAEIYTQAALRLQRCELVAQSAANLQDFQTLRYEKPEIPQLILVIVSSPVLPACALTRQSIKSFGNLALAEVISLHVLG